MGYSGASYTRTLESLLKGLYCLSFITVINLISPSELWNNAQTSSHVIENTLLKEQVNMKTIKTQIPKDKNSTSHLFPLFYPFCYFPSVIHFIFIFPSLFFYSLTFPNSFPISVLLPPHPPTIPSSRYPSFLQGIPILVPSLHSYISFIFFFLPSFTLFAFSFILLSPVWLSIEPRDRIEAEVAERR